MCSRHDSSCGGMSAAAAVLLLAAATCLTIPAAAVSSAIPAQVHAPYRTGSISADSHHNQQAAHKHPVDARHAHYSGENRREAALKIPAPSHTQPRSDPPHIRGVGSLNTGSSSSSHHEAHKPALETALPEIGPDGKPLSCHSWGSELNVETPEDQLDRPYGIDPATGRAPDEEDAAEDAIAHAAKKAGMDALTYAAEHDEATHTAPSPHVAAHALSPDIAESLQHGFRLSYQLQIWFKRHSTHRGDVQLLTQFSSIDNHGLLDSFGEALKGAMFEILPDGVSDMHTINWIPGNPLEVDLVIYPDLLIPDDINPTWVLKTTDHIMHTIVAANLSADFLETWNVDEILVTSHPDNQHEIVDSEQVFPLHEELQTPKASGSLVKSLALFVFVACPMAVGAAIAAQALFTLYQSQKKDHMLPKYPAFANSGLKSACGSSGGLATSNVAAIYATSVDYYAGPYRTSYSSGGGNISSHRSSMPGSSADESRYTTPRSTDGGAQ